MIERYLFVVCMPFIWYALTKNHSYVHSKYTYRNLLITIMPMLIIDFEIIKKYLKIKKEKQK